MDKLIFFQRSKFDYFINILEGWVAESLIQPGKYTFFHLEICASRKNEDRFPLFSDEFFVKEIPSILELDQDLIFFDGLLQGNFDVLHHAVTRGFDAVFHFHGFQDQQYVSFFD